MSGRIILDTNVIISLFSEDTALNEYILNADEVFIPCIAIGELYYGACKSSKIQENLNKIDEFAAGNIILPCDTNTAMIYGDIKNALKEKGKPIPENDIWIAAIARQYDLILITKDNHFSFVEKIHIELL
ncbi:MAG: type II toxin-antitoxin system VapC family toxin [Deltaproteobacteria bacterium]|nr:type II toxin-antitoxin system VapC family toxin [Deltaproteobacteria bacterium]